MKQQEGYNLLPRENNSISKSGIKSLLDQVRPSWRNKSLVKRVEALLPVDPSSACQRLFNAAIHDLKQKIIIIGVGLAKECAIDARLPNINNEEDILNYRTSRIIDLAYRMSLLTRGEWRRMHRCYEIRRDLEHEDYEYEAVLEDCIYIFKSAIDIVLSQDPIEILKVTEAKELIENSTNFRVSDEFTTNYRSAPTQRKEEILKMLISNAYDDSKPDIVRMNSVELMRILAPLTPNEATIAIAAILEGKLAGKTLDIKTAKIANACGAIAYFKKVRLKDFYKNLLEEVDNASSDWDAQYRIMDKIEDVGGLNNCPLELYRQFIKLFVTFYIGEPSYGQYSYSRSVFFSNSAAPIIKRVLNADKARIGTHLESIRKDKDIIASIQNIHVARRFDALQDLAEE